MKITLIHNPSAGEGTLSDPVAMVAMIQSAGHQVSYHSSKEQNWMNALDDPTDLVAVAGGDGTLGKVARSLVGRQIPITVLPGGTANNLAATLGLMNIPWPQLVAGWSNATYQPFDVGVAGGPWGEKTFLESLGAGLFAWTLATFDKGEQQKRCQPKDVNEEVQSARKFLREPLKEFSPRLLKIKLDGRDQSDAFLMVEAMNIKTIGPQLELAPEADPGDGWLDVVLIAGEHRDRLRKSLQNQAEAWESAGSFTVHRAQNLQIEGEWSEFHLDDRPWPDPQKESKPGPYVVDVRLDPRALVFMIPDLAGA